MCEWQEIGKKEFFAFTCSIALGSRTEVKSLRSHQIKPINSRIFGFLLLPNTLVHTRQQDTNGLVN